MADLDYVTEAQAVALATATAARLDANQAAAESAASAVEDKAGDRLIQATGSIAANSPNLLAGHAGNAIASDIGGGVILGGGTPGRENVIGGDGSVTVGTGNSNVPTLGTGADLSIIPGGYDNVAGGLASVVVGFHNWTGLDSSHGTISGGSNSKIPDGDYCTIGGGTANTITGTRSTIGGGEGNLASGIASTIGGGQWNTASGNAASVLGGTNNTASGTSSTAMGNRSVARENGARSLAATQFAVPGDQQTSERPIGLTTTTATTASITLAQLIQPNSAVVWCAFVIAHDVATGDAKAWKVEGAYRCDATTTITQIGGAAVPAVIVADAGAAAWTLTTLAGTGTMNLRATGEAGKTIRWVCRFEYTEVI